MKTNHPTGALHGSLVGTVAHFYFTEKNAIHFPNAFKTNIKFAEDHEMSG